MFTPAFRQQQNSAWQSIAAQLATIFSYGLFETPQALAHLTDLPRNLHNQFDRWVAALEHHARLLILAIALRMEPPAQTTRTRATKKRTRTPPDPDTPSTWRATLRILPSLSLRTGRRALPSKAARERRNARLRQQREHQRRLRDSVDRHAALTGELRLPRGLKNDARFDAFLRELEDIEYGRVSDRDTPGACTYEEMMAAPWTDADETCLQELYALEGLAPDGSPLTFQPENRNPEEASTGETQKPGASRFATDDARYSRRLRAALAASAAEPANPIPPKPRPAFPLARRMQALLTAIADPKRRARSLARTLQRRRERNPSQTITLPQPPPQHLHDPIFHDDDIHQATAMVISALDPGPDPREDSS